MRFGKLLCMALIAGGIMTMLSGVISIVETVALFGPTEEREIGITRGSLFVQFGAVFAFGLAMLVFGIRGRGKIRKAEDK